MQKMDFYLKLKILYIRVYGNQIIHSQKYIYSIKKEFEVWSKSEEMTK